MTVQEIRELIGKKTEEINGYLESRDADKAEAALEEKRKLQRLLAVREAEDDEEKEELRGQKHKKEEKSTASAVSELRAAVKFALKPKHFMLDAARPTYQALKEIAEEEYEKTLKEKLGE